MESPITASHLPALRPFPPAPADVPLDLADSLDRLAPEGTQQRYRHDDEGPDDMPAHLKAGALGLAG